VSLPEPTGFDAPDRLDAFLDAVRWGAASTADLKNIQAPFRAGIDIEDYQLDPVVRAIQMLRVNLLIADDVGLGKTIESGLVALELIIRHRARRVLVVCSASLQIQWRDQMRDKFGLDFRIVDSDLMRELGDPTEMGEFPEEQRAPLSRTDPKWVPTSEVRGEGVFLQFSEPAIEKWIKKTRERDREFFEAHRRWRQSRGLKPDDGFPTMRYVLLHSLAHALIRQFALECGYTTASIRERIYSRPPGSDRDPMAGILLYTAAPDSEGTLGGLVALGETDALGRHLDQALEAMRLCASDPLCAEHHPIQDGLTLHGAACHAYLFLPETSCERGNKYLDRSVLGATVESNRLAFFPRFAEVVPEATIQAETDESSTPPKPVRMSLSAADLELLLEE
jgi:hypothetical protein